MKSKRILFIVAAAASVLSAFACGSMAGVGTTASVPDLNGRPGRTGTRYPERMFLVEWNQDHSNCLLSEDRGRTVAGAKFDVGFNVRSLSFHMPTSVDNTENSVVFKLYKWNSNYDATVNSDPIVIITRTNISNNETVVFEVNEGVAGPGTYLWTLSNAVMKTPDGHLGIWYANSESMIVEKDTVFYLDGDQTHTYLYKCIVSGIMDEEAKDESTDS